MQPRAAQKQSPPPAPATAPGPRQSPRADAGPGRQGCGRPGGLTFLGRFHLLLGPAGALVHLHRSCEEDRAHWRWPGRTPRPPPAARAPRRHARTRGRPRATRRGAGCQSPRLTDGDTEAVQGPDCESCLFTHVVGRGWPCGRVQTGGAGTWALDRRGPHLSVDSPGSVALRGGVLGTPARLAASLASTHQMPLTPHSKCHEQKRLRT